MVHMNTKYKTPQLAAQNKDGLVVVSLLFKVNIFDNFATDILYHPLLLMRYIRHNITR
jgi:hypothetical protein